MVFKRRDMFKQTHISRTIFEYAYRNTMNSCQVDCSVYVCVSPIFFKTFVTFLLLDFLKKFLLLRYSVFSFYFETLPVRM